MIIFIISFFICSLLMTLIYVVRKNKELRGRIDRITNTFLRTSDELAETKLVLGQVLLAQRMDPRSLEMQVWIWAVRITEENRGCFGSYVGGIHYCPLTEEVIWTIGNSAKVHKVLFL